MTILVFFTFTSRPIELQKSNRMLILTCKALGLRARRTRSLAQSRYDIRTSARTG